MASKLPEPGYYRSNDKDVLVLDPATLSDTGEVVTKDAGDANWRPAVIFKRAFAPGSPTYVLSANVFDGRFHETTKEEAFARVQKAEFAASAEAARDEMSADAESGAATAEAEGATSGVATP